MQQYPELINKSATLCLQKLIETKDIFDNILQHTEFWHTWSNYEVAPVIMQLSCIHPSIKSRTLDLITTKWTKFDIDKGAPAYHKDRSLISNKDFWDKDNTNCLWDDRQWLGVAYTELYRASGQEKYLKTAQKLFNFLLSCNAYPLAPDYIGLNWKSGHEYRNSITNQLFLVLVARLYDITKNSIYMECLKAQFKFLFKQQGLYINCNSDNIFPDGKGPGGFWSYNQAMSFEALAYLIVFTGEEEYMNQLIRLTKGTLAYFRDESCQKRICWERTFVGDGDLNTFSIFRSYLFRHLYYAKKVISRVPAKWDQWNEEVPLLRTFILDNFQAMCKFEDCEPPYRWEGFTGPKHYYNCFNHFFICAAAEEMYGIKECWVDGVDLKCNNTFNVSLNPAIERVILSKFITNGFTGIYSPVQHFELSHGLNYMQAITGQNICAENNNNNFFGLTIIYKNGAEAYHALIHLENGSSKFGMLMDCNQMEMVNTRVFAIRAKKNWPITYNSKQTGQIIVLQSEQGPRDENLMINF